MSEAVPEKPVHATDPEVTHPSPSEVVHESGRGRAKVRLIVGMTMLGLSVVGLGVTNFFKAHAWGYWLVMVPVFGILCLVSRWMLHPEEGRPSWSRIGLAALHWVGLLVAIYLVLVFVDMGFLSAENAAPMVLMMLALTTYLAGLHIDWTFVLVGACLAVFAYVTVWAEEYLFVLLLPVAIVAAIMVYVWRKRHPPMIGSG